MATDWEYDRDFVELIARVAFYEYGLRTHVVEPANLQETIDRYRDGSLDFNFFYDRGSDTSPEFMELNDLAARDNVPILDSMQQLKWASDKATMHLEFIANGLRAPYTIIIPPHTKQPALYLSEVDLAKLGSSFIIKPANTTGGGIGVIEGAETNQDILKFRQEFKDDKYLLQERIEPLAKDGKRFWFRGFFCCGLVTCSWWDPRLHIYELLTPEHVEMYRLEELYSLVEKISRIIRLNFFSTEIALNGQGQFIFIDYVNEVCDMRLKSKHGDGVPDQIVTQIAKKIAAHVKVNKKIRTC